jgi:hypothetical protein
MSKDEYREFPDTSKMKIDFSEAHVLDHWPWECRRYEYAKGGWRTHLRYAWDFKWYPRLRAATTCKVGIHYETQVGSREMVWTACLYCAKPMSERQMR